MPSYSYSKLRTFDACPAAYRKKYIDREDAPKSLPLISGSVLHEIFDRYIRYCLSAKVNSALEEIERIAREAINDPEVRKDAPLPVDLVDDVIAVSRRFAERVAVTPTLYGTEERLAFKRDLTPCDWNDPEVWWRSKLDRLEMAAEVADVTDYKSGYHASADDFQGEVYAWAVMLAHPKIMRVRSAFDFPRLGIVKPGPELERADMDRVEKKILALISRIEAEKSWTPTPGAACVTANGDAACDYFDTCPARPFILACIKTREDAERIAADLLINENENTRLTKILKPWCTVNGMVECNGLRFGFHVSESAKFSDIAAFRSACDAAGISADDFLAVNGTKAKKLIGREDFAGIVSVEHKQTWGHRKVKDGEDE